MVYVGAQSLQANVSLAAIEAERTGDLANKGDDHDAKDGAGDYTIQETLKPITSPATIRCLHFFPAKLSLGTY